MTNGEKIVQLFPNAQVDKGETRIYVWLDHSSTTFDREWWNAEYKDPNHIADTDKMMGSTTKNCRSCRNFGSHHGICEICKDNKCWTEKEPTTRNCFGCKYSKDNHTAGTEECHLCMWENQYTPTTKNDLRVDWESYKDVDGNSLDDLILEVLQNNFDCGNTYGYKVADEIIELLPSVTPQPKHGIWQQTNKNEVNVIPEYRCSECGAEYKGFGFDFDYCPRCGSAMEVEE